MKAKRIDHNESESTRTHTSNRRGFLKVTGASLVAASLASIAKAAPDDERRVVSLPLGTTGLAFGQSLRATLSNLGTRRSTSAPDIGMMRTGSPVRIQALE